MRFVIQTFGCKVNQYESIGISNAMTAAGFTETEDISSADVVIINSCTVTENSSKKACHAVRAAKAANPNGLVVLSGCFPQAFPDKARESGADIIAGTAERNNLPGLITAFFEGRTSSPLPQLPRSYEELDFCRTTGKTRAFIKIEDGCDRFCSYCIIPYARGHVRSRSLESIKEEAAACVRDGHKEIVLVGINLSCYGKDTGKSLADAVEAVASFPEILRVRLSSLEPELLDEEMCRRLASCKKLCPHFHLSLQSGCDETLKRMNRHYTSEEYFEIVSRLRRYFPDCAVTTDIMVGFAGETEEEFQQSLAFAERVGFSKIHVFTYSVREGTAAAKRTDHIPESVKADRYKRMSELDRRLNREFLEKQVGKTADIIVQKRTSPDFAAGLTPNYTMLHIPGSNAQKQDVIKVRITAACEGFCIGEEAGTAGKDL